MVKWPLSEGALITAFDVVCLSGKQTSVGVKDVYSNAISPLNWVTSV